MVQLSLHKRTRGKRTGGMRHNDEGIASLLRVTYCKVQLRNFSIRQLYSPECDLITIWIIAGRND